MKALLELRGRSPGGTRRRWGTAGEGHPTVPEQLAGRWPGEPGGHLVAGRFRLRSLAITDIAPKMPLTAIGTPVQKCAQPGRRRQPYR
jgi:hypothetical protein